MRLAHKPDLLVGHDLDSLIGRQKMSPTLKCAQRRMGQPALPASLLLLKGLERLLHMNCAVPHGPWQIKLLMLHGDKPSTFDELVNGGAFPRLVPALDHPGCGALRRHRDAETAAKGVPARGVAWLEPELQSLRCLGSLFGCLPTSLSMQRA